MLDKKRKCFCAFCKTPRVVQTKKRIGFVNIVFSTVAAIIVMYTVFQKFDPKVIFVFITFLIISETFIQFRWRLNIVCPDCGFDPALYLKNPEAAAEKVKMTLERRKKDPYFLLRSPLRIPVLRKEKESTSTSLIQKQKSAQNKGNFVSKQI